MNVTIELTTEVMGALLETYGDRDGEGWSRFYWSDVTELDIPGVGLAKVIEEKHGGEGDYDVDTHVIFRVEFVDGQVKYYRKRGRYQSFSGTDWDGVFEEVHPVEKLVTVFE